MSRREELNVGVLQSDVCLQFTKAYTVANAPAASKYPRGLIYLSNGAAGSPCLAISNGTNWLRCDTLATAAAT
jgi:hypothetical protein